MSDRRGALGDGGTELANPSAAMSTDSSQGSSVRVEELRVSAIDPLDSGSSSDGRTQLFEEVVHPAPRPRDALEASRRDPVDLPPGSVVGEYEIERKLGQGGMGVVYAAVHPILGKRAAIKVISDGMARDADSIARFRREARSLAQLASPHIVDVFGFGELADGRPYFVMEYLTGEPLRARLDRGRVPLDEALELIDQIVRGLEAAHEAGIVHRDLKPENIFIERKRSAPAVVKLLDFGIVKVVHNDDGIATTQTGALIGTPVYMAPEQIKAAGSVDHRADIYALGGVAFEMILGRVPFERKTVAELVGAHLECMAPQPRTLWRAIPTALDALLSAMLAKDPAKRPTLGHVQETIDALRRSAFTTANPASSIRDFASQADLAPNAVRVMPPPRRRSTARFAVAVAAVGAIVVIAIATSKSSNETNASDASTPVSIAIDAGARVSPIAPADLADAAVVPNVGVASPIAKPSAPQRVRAKPPASRPPIETNDAPPVTTPAKPALEPEPQHVPPPSDTTPPVSPEKPLDRNQTINPFPPKPSSK